MTDDADRLTTALLEIEQEREDRDVLEAQRRIKQQDALAEAAEQDALEAARQAREHAAAVLDYYNHLLVLRGAMAQVDAAITTLAGGLVGIEHEWAEVVRLGSRVGSNAKALEQESSVQLLANLRHDLSIPGLPPIVRSAVAGPIPGAVLRPLTSIVDPELARVFQQIPTVGPSQPEVSQ